MPRRNRPAKHPVAPDPVYNSESLAKFVNIVMRNGKRSVAEKIMYDALRRAGRQTRKEPLEVFDQALRNATPLVEVKPRRVGGATYQVPIEIRPDRRLALARRWLVRFARQRDARGEPDAVCAARVCHAAPIRRARLRTRSWTRAGPSVRVTASASRPYPPGRATRSVHLGRRGDPCISDSCRPPYRTAPRPA